MHPIINLAEAFELGYTPSTLRTLARCLDRISKSKSKYVNFDPVVNRRNAFLFRKLASDMEIAKTMFG